MVLPFCVSTVKRAGWPAVVVQQPVAVAIGQADALQQRRGARRIVLGLRKIRHEPVAVARRDRPEQRFGGAEEHRVDEGAAIDGVRDRVAQFLALQPRPILGGGRAGARLNQNASGLMVMPASRA